MPHLCSFPVGGRVRPEENDERLDDRARAILDFERSWWLGLGPKERAIRARFDLSPARYYHLLSRLIDSPEAVRYEPMLIRRLRRLRTARRRQRFARDYGLGR